MLRVEVWRGVEESLAMTEAELLVEDKPARLMRKGRSYTLRKRRLFIASVRSGTCRKLAGASRFTVLIVNPKPIE
jgi:hypothetical protein